MAKILEPVGENKDLNSSLVVKHVSETLKDESNNNSGPPALFRHASMEKIRHCCQNLNLFPYLLYSFDNSTSHPLARKVNVCVSQILTNIADRLFFLYKSVRQAALRGIFAKKYQQVNNKTTVTPEIKPIKPSAKFQKYEKQKRKETPFLLVVAVYFAPLMLGFQMFALGSLVIFGKYNPGFIFLTTSLLCLGCIAMKVFFQDSNKRFDKCHKRKVQ